MVTRSAERESDFDTWMLGAARLRGWLAFHQRPAMRKDGEWRSATQGDKGFPDWCLAKNGLILLWELKVPPNTPSAEQRLWLAQGARLWYPCDKPVMLAILAGDLPIDHPALSADLPMPQRGAVHHNPVRRGGR